MRHEAGELFGGAIVGDDGSIFDLMPGEDGVQEKPNPPPVGRMSLDQEVGLAIFNGLVKRYMASGMSEEDAYEKAADEIRRRRGAGERLSLVTPSPKDFKPDLPVTDDELDWWRLLTSHPGKTQEQHELLRLLHDKVMRQQADDDALRRARFEGKKVGPPNVDQGGESVTTEEARRRRYAEHYQRHIESGHTPETAHRNAAGDIMDERPPEVRLSLYDVQSLAWNAFLESGGRRTPDNARALAADVDRMLASKSPHDVLAALAERFRDSSG
jgi:hypothetical protein